ncbi:MAG: CBS domain-containing protein [Actinomycetota bacterium]|nr:CBS domain-containing protein [Actinomycetota bacterium]MDK1016668.1 CBS domain-containing protein [Actinomycetota bacterium]MDK1027054.1 CBS domain-containing protein [Actinomycetota bacterium]MDK1038614.1 CBS domain-containing protein [Actinomycetota bacterium]MDK1096531.1 CBS domain-containing protein [Actinomycetota bacterium]
MRLAALVGGEAEIVGPEATLSDVAKVMEDRQVGAVAVVERSDLVGICTDRDLAMALGRACGPEDPVSICMTEAPDVVDPDVPVSEAAAWMLETGYRHLPVMADGELLGIIDVRDLLWALIDSA